MTPCRLRTGCAFTASSFTSVPQPGRRRQHELAVLDHRRVGEHLVAPRHLVDVVFHDAIVRDRGAEMRADIARQMPGEIMRRAVDLERVAQRGDAHRFPHAVPLHVDDGDIAGIVREERLERRSPWIVSSDAIGVVVERRSSASASGIVDVAFEPGQVEVFQRIGDADEALGTLAEIEVEA